MACMGPGSGIAGSVTLVIVPLPPVASRNGTPSVPKWLDQAHSHEAAPAEYGGAPLSQDRPGVTACVGSPPNVVSAWAIAVKPPRLSTEATATARASRVRR